MKSTLYVKDICKNKGMSLKELAAKVNVSPSALSQVLSSDNPGVKTLEAIAAALDVSFVDLFTYPNQALIDSHMVDFRNNMAKDLYLKFCGTSPLSDTEIGLDDCTIQYCIEKASQMANALSGTGKKNKYSDENFKFAVFMYTDGKPTNFIGVFNTYDRALEISLENIKPFIEDMGGDYMVKGVNMDYCSDKLEKLGDVIWCDNQVLFSVEPTEAYLKKNPGDQGEKYSYVVRTLFLDTPLMVTEID